MDKIKDIDIYISEIAERLWSGHASLMIGAGFSMNAKRSSLSAKKFPSWNDLGDVFYKKLYGRVPTDQDKCYLDALKLAEEVEASFGRSALNKILRDEIPDTEYQPSDLHETLLQLPWIDIFTTNYDTLLERTAEKILEQRYETVINKEDLVWSTKPRIIKLHGSFPSETPFIITEEDYRKYPKEYAPFVNTVQQSLLENTLCLIGFSGNDPNFQNWIGWIRDNLGKENSPKIFLIGKLSLSIGQKRLLENRNIVPIDLSCYSKDHTKALTEFVDKLIFFGRPKENNLDFPNNENRIRFDKNREINSQFTEIINIWKKTRLSYPNWLILPTDNREKLYDLTDMSFIYNISDVKSFVDIEFLYEFNWRIEKCLLPIINDWTQSYENVIAKYNPFPNLLVNETAIITPNICKDIDWKLISNYWCELQLSLLRYYREENFKEKWIKLSEQIEIIKVNLSPELYAKYSYERCLYFMFLLEISSVRKELNKWLTDFSLPYWEAKRAGMLAELGDVETAEQILEVSLSEIRNRLRFSPISTDYTLVSQESYVLQLSRYVRRSINFTKGIYKNDENKNYSERWNELVKYKCDPWGELKSFESSLKIITTNKQSVEKKYGFKIGNITTKSLFGNGSPYILKSYAFLRYIEETGIPLKLSNITFAGEAAKKAVVCISNYSPNWGFVSFIRTGDTKILDDIFNRRSLSFLTQQKCDELTSFYLSILVKSTKEIEKGDIRRNENFAISLSKIIPRILSRLCVKCSYEVKIKILDFLKELYLTNPEQQSKYTGIDSLCEFLIKSFSIKEQYYLIPELLSFPLIIDHNGKKSFPDLISFIKPIVFKKSLKIKSEVINEAISLLSPNNDKRKLAITRLIKLWKCGLLTKYQEERFSKALWKCTDDNGFPSDTDYYYFAFLIFPHPKNVNPQKKIQDYLKNILFPIEGKNEKGITIRGGDFYEFHNILGTSDNEISYQWNKEEINKLLSDCIEWWNTDKEYLLQDQNRSIGSISDEFKLRFKNMIRIFSYVIISHIELVDSVYNKQIANILKELSKYNMPDLEAKVSFIELFPNIKRETYNEIKLKLYSKNEENILDAVNAISILTIYGNKDIPELIKCVSENIKNRSEIGLDKFLVAMKVVLKYDSKLLTNDILNDLEVGLDFLYNEIPIKFKDTDESVYNKMLIKRNASNLLVLLKKYYIDELKIDLPEYIKNWENMCLDENEFSEIRNIWINDSYYNNF